MVASTIYCLSPLSSPSSGVTHFEIDLPLFRAHFTVFGPIFPVFRQITLGNGPIRGQKFLFLELLRHNTLS